ncbi:Inward rectifier potassium channel 2 domain protein [Dirofilaria immitis]|nr:Inward rectifier potassium channel 2 domain protein [Dirofilaria immitis]
MVNNNNTLETQHTIGYGFRLEIKFSQIAVIGPVNDTDRRPALMIRIADIRNNLYIAEPHVRLYMATSQINKKGERELVDFKDLNVGYDSGWDRVLLLWPITVKHLIDDQSPLFAMTPDAMHNEHFELIMIVGRNCRSYWYDISSSNFIST